MCDQQTHFVYDVANIEHFQLTAFRPGKENNLIFSKLQFYILNSQFCS